MDPGFVESAKFLTLTPFLPPRSWKNNTGGPLKEGILRRRATGEGYKRAVRKRQTKRNN